MNKKLIYIFVFLVLGLFVVSACNLIKQEEVGRNVNRNIAIADDMENIVYQNITYNLSLGVNPVSTGYIKIKIIVGGECLLPISVVQFHSP